MIALAAVGPAEGVTLNLQSWAARDDIWGLRFRVSYSAHSGDIFIQAKKKYCTIVVWPYTIVVL